MSSYMCIRKEPQNEKSYIFIYTTSTYVYVCRLLRIFFFRSVSILSIRQTDGKNDKSAPIRFFFFCRTTKRNTAGSGRGKVLVSVRRVGGSGECMKIKFIKLSVRRVGSGAPAAVDKSSVCPTLPE